MPDLKSLKIVHVTRTPVGGIFRHILDVASGRKTRSEAQVAKLLAERAHFDDQSTGQPRAHAIVETFEVRRWKIGRASCRERV